MIATWIQIPESISLHVQIMSENFKENQFIMMLLSENPSLMKTCATYIFHIFRARIKQDAPIGY